MLSWHSRVLCLTLLDMSNGMRKIATMWAPVIAEVSVYHDPLGGEVTLDESWSFTFT